MKKTLNISDADVFNSKKNDKRRFRVNAFLKKNLVQQETLDDDVKSPCMKLTVNT